MNFKCGVGEGGMEWKRAQIPLPLWQTEERPRCPLCVPTRGQSSPCSHSQSLKNINKRIAIIVSNQRGVVVDWLTPRLSMEEGPNFGTNDDFNSPKKPRNVACDS